MYQRKEMILEATRQAMKVRNQAGLKLWDSVCIYDLTQQLDIDLWFSDLPTAEGIYHNDSPPRIIVTSLRPPGRQAFTCAHELGHHIFGHGTTIDEITNSPQNKPEEFIVDCFAGMLLMPKTGVSQAFTDRGWNLKNSTPIQVYSVAGWFGVGYGTLIQQLSTMLGMLPREHADVLRKYQPKQIRKQILGWEIEEELVVVDFRWNTRPVDIQVGDLIHLPPNVVDDQIGTYLTLESIDAGPNCTVFRGRKPGHCKLYNLEHNWATFVRVTRRQFVGRSKYRHMEDPDDEQ